MKARIKVYSTTEGKLSYMPQRSALFLFWVNLLKRKTNSKPKAVAKAMQISNHVRFKYIFTKLDMTKL